MENWQATKENILQAVLTHWSQGAVAVIQQGYFWFHELISLALVLAEVTLSQIFRQTTVNRCNDVTMNFFMDDVRKYHLDRWGMNNDKSQQLTYTISDEMLQYRREPSRTMVYDELQSHTTTYKAELLGMYNDAVWIKMHGNELAQPTMMQNDAKWTEAT